MEGDASALVSGNQAFKKQLCAVMITKILWPVIKSSTNKVIDGDQCNLTFKHKVKLGFVCSFVAMCLAYNKVMPKLS